MNYVLGIDGGGTKTVAAIADSSGKVVAQTTVGSTNPNSSTAKDLDDTFMELFSNLRKELQADFDHITHLFAGIAGAGNEENKHDLTEIIKRFVPTLTSLQVVPDPINALYSGTLGEPGIVQISGTGSVTYGIDSEQRHARVGGWGYLLGDEGSGYDIGRQAILAVLKAYDGRGSETNLTKLVFTHFNTENPQDIIGKIYGSNTPKNEISAITKLLFQAYHENDSVADRIVETAAEEMMFSIQTLYRKLFSKDDKVEVVLCGGVFNEYAVVDQIKKRLKNHTELTVVLPKMPPVGGSLIGAYLLNGTAPDSDIINNIIHTI
ncbi:N-acetylglucosamine kinase [Oceanobacillus damuensis]|uniref:N-acetylglucosamine kinase n=1 Tax=Oceanobacillus damuensis TaxID=937928 RepID=UPI00082A0A9E|nr:BadF/BadG/BcrA/BcrD ATPase family protein [Oceanobacillus damuensis]